MLYTTGRARAETLCYGGRELGSFKELKEGQNVMLGA